MKKIIYYKKKKYFEYLKYQDKLGKCSKEYKILQNNWKKFRLLILYIYGEKKFSKKYIKKVLPPYVNRILLGSFEKLNQIYDFSEYLTEQERELAQYIFNYGFNLKPLSDVLKQIPFRYRGWFYKIKKTLAKDSCIAEYFIENHTELNISTCFYCDSSYIHAFPGITKPKRLFQLDHFFGKVKCPIVALSLKNLIPCCPICNSSTIKGQAKLKDFYKITSKGKHTDFSIYSPTSNKYLYGEEVRIRLVPKDPTNWIPESPSKNNSEDFEIKFITTLEEHNNITDAFKLNERYNYEDNKGYAIMLSELKNNYPDSYIEMLSYCLFSNGIELTPKEIKESIFHDMEKGRTFGKMKKDILE